MRSTSSPRAATSVATSRSRRAVAQLGDDLLALHLAEVAVDRLGGETAAAQAFGDVLGGRLGADEDEHRLAGLDLEDAGQRVHLLLAGDQQVALPRVRGGDRLVLDGDLDRVVQVARRDLLDRPRHGGREQRDLLVVRGVAQDAFDVLLEAHAQHLVGLVEDQVLQRRQVERPLLQVVDHAAGRADDDVGAAPQGRQLRTVGLTAVDGQHVQALDAVRVAAEGLGDLQHQLAGGSEHQCLGRRAARVDRGQDRQRESGRLAGAGLRQPDEVTSLDEDRDRALLDGGRHLVPEVLEGADHARVEPEVVEAAWRVGGGGAVDGHT